MCFMREKLTHKSLFTTLTTRVLRRIQTQLMTLTFLQYPYGINDSLTGLLSPYYLKIWSSIFFGAARSFSYMCKSEGFVFLVPTAYLGW